MTEGCQRFQRALEELLDLQASSEEAAALVDHLAHCHDCRGVQAARLHLRDLVRGCMGKGETLAPPALRARILVSIHRETLTRIRWVERGPAGGAE